MSDPISREVLARYLAGTATADEEARVRAWLAEHPHARLQLEGLDVTSDDLRRRRDPDAALARMKERMAAPVRRSRLYRLPGLERWTADSGAAPSVRTLAPYLRVAAVVCLLALAGVLGYRLLYSEGGAPVLREVATARGERQRVVLPDGSVVELNVASVLRYPASFGDGERVVQLVGEAFFDVAADPDRPFVIQSGAAVVRVLGTAFNVEAYPEAPEVTVAVAEGRVAFRAEAQGDDAAVTLQPGDLGRLAVTAAPGVGPVLTVEHGRVDRYLAWREGRLVFEGTPLREVARELARWYDVDVALSDAALGARRLDATFGDEPLRRVLDVVAAALEIDYRLEGRRVVFSPSTS